MTANIWDFWAKRYERLWVQKYSLRPTREFILNKINKYIIDDKSTKILDLGCGPGELIHGLGEKYKTIKITGIDFSEKMLEVSKERNPRADHIQMNVNDLNKLDDNYDIIICTHSLPYYKTPNKVMEQLFRILNNDGRVIIGFASGDSFYDKLALAFVKLTTGSANYPSDIKFKEIIYPYFKVDDLKIIKEKPFMPRIAIYTLEKVNK